MSVRVLLRESPHRAIALVTDSHALIFRHSPSSIELTANSSVGSFQSLQFQPPPTNAISPRCMVEFLESSSVDLTDYRPLTPLPAHGTLGLITIANDVFLCVVTGALQVATVRPRETVKRIHGVEFYCLNRKNFDYSAHDDLNAHSSDDYYQDGSDYGNDGHLRDPALEHPCLALRKLLSGGSFYFSSDFDITNRLQRRSLDSSTFDADNLDDDYLWNSYMIEPLVKFRSRLNGLEREALDSSYILTSVIRGFVLTSTIPQSSSPARTLRSGLPSTLTLISRLSCRRAGTRFNARGIDDDGNVANFVETETVFWTPGGLCFSYVQIRGSVPVFWEQATNLLPGQQKIQITRSQEATQPAFDKHFEGLEVNYGSTHVLNLLSESRPGEAELTRRYRFHIRHSPLSIGAEKGAMSDHSQLRETEYDFHAETRGPAGYEAASGIRRLIRGSAEGFAYYLSEEIEEQIPSHAGERSVQTRPIVVLQQGGVFRTNCLDCLDRTNLIQTIVSQMAIESFLSSRDERASPDFWMRHSSLWADNGDNLSKIYAGTGALKSSFTRHGKMSLAGAIADVRKSATRLYINNFADKARQETIDILLGRIVGQNSVHLYDPINDYMTSELNKRSQEYTSSKTIRIWAGTLNLNGRTTGLDEDLSPWLCPDTLQPQEEPEVVAVGFQEIVELSPQQIMSTDPARRQRWEAVVKRTLNKRAHKLGAEEYVLLRSGQLVGAALSIFVKVSVLPHIKNVEGSVKKTGMSGMAGNKGAVAIRMDYAKTQICFVTAHLAAGFANYEERNRDYKTINHGLRFQRDRSIEDHDTVIWLGDFNYRIGLGDEKVRKAISVGDLGWLYENDQLNIQMVAGMTFPHYAESRITFPPTYKYDIGTDRYDTSEKSRIPAWTDRVLRKGANLRQLDYGTAALRFSDHRPVYATFQCIITIVDEAMKEQLSREIYERRRIEVGDSTANTHADDTDDEELIGYDSINPDLPPASSDRRKWWLDNGAPAQSGISRPGKDYVLNPNRPSNPFTETNEPDWVYVDRPLRPAMSRDSTTNTLSTIESSTGSVKARRLPPPFETIGNSTSSLSSQPTTAEGRRQSSSTLSNKKAAPPVPKKPDVLSPQPTGRSTANGASNTMRQSRGTIGSVPDSGGPVSLPDQSNFPPPPRQPIQQAYQDHNMPPVPRRQEPNDYGRTTLMDEGDEANSMASWKPLRPQ